MAVKFCYVMASSAHQRFCWLLFPIVIKSIISFSWCKEGSKWVTTVEHVRSIFTSSKSQWYFSNLMKVALMLRPTWQRDIAGVPKLQRSASSQERYRVWADTSRSVQPSPAPRCKRLPSSRGDGLSSAKESLAQGWGRGRGHGLSQCTPTKLHLK